MKLVKTLWNNFLHFICKIYGYDLKADQAKTEAMIQEAHAEMEAAVAETAAVQTQAEERIAELKAEDAHNLACHEVYMAILELCRKRGYNMKPANVANQNKDLEELKQILDAMQNGDYDPEPEVAVRQPKRPKVKRLSRQAAHA